MKRALLVVVLAFGLASTTAAFSTGTGARTSRPPIGLTPSGRILWNFEGLLTRTFGKRFFGVKVQGLGYPPNFVGAAACPNAAACDGFLFTFARHSATAFHLTSVRPAGSFGNYPQLVRVRGKYVACNANSSRYLITYSDTMNFGLDCLRPA